MSAEPKTLAELIQAMDALVTGINTQQRQLDDLERKVSRLESQMRFAQSVILEMDK